MATFKSTFMIVFMVTFVFSNIANADVNTNDTGVSRSTSRIAGLGSTSFGTSDFPTTYSSSLSQSQIDAENKRLASLNDAQLRQYFSGIKDISVMKTWTKDIKDKHLNYMQNFKKNHEPNKPGAPNNCQKKPGAPNNCQSHGKNGLLSETVYTNADGTGYKEISEINKDGKTRTFKERINLTAEEITAYKESIKNDEDTYKMNENTYNVCLADVQAYGFNISESALQNLLKAFFLMTLEDFIDKPVTNFSKSYYFHLIENVSLNLSEMKDPMNWCVIVANFNKTTPDACQYHLFNSNIFGLSLKSIVHNIYYNFEFGLKDITNGWVLQYFVFVSRSVKFSSFMLMNPDSYCKERAKAHFVLESIEYKAIENHAHVDVEILNLQ